MTPKPRQQENIERLLRVIPSVGAAVDGSDCGLGKTLVAVEVMRRLNKATLAVCPKSVIPSWNRHAAAQGTDISAVNWEMVRTGNTPYGRWGKRPDTGDDIFIWSPGIEFLVFDEVHRAMTHGSKNSLLVKAARRQRIPALALSATLADSVMELDAVGYLLRLHDGDDKPTLRNLSPVHFLEWARKYGAVRTDRGFDFVGTPGQKRAHMAELNKLLYPHRGVRTKISDLGDEFLGSTITAELYDLGSPEEIDALYAEMAEPLDRLKKRSAHDYHDDRTKLLRARQKVELLKVPGVVEIAKGKLAMGMSVALFVNFKETLAELCKRLDTDCFIDGSQVGPAGAIRREANRSRFVADESRVIVCNSEAGGVGIDLPDLHGNHPRFSGIFPGYNAKSIQQVLGRVARTSSVTRSIQQFFYADGTVEVPVFRTMTNKLANMRALNDGIEITDEELTPSFG